MTLPPHIATAITRFDDAAQAVGVMKDGPQPDNWGSIVHQYDQARERLVRAIEKAIDR